MEAEEKNIWGSDIEYGIQSKKLEWGIVNLEFQTYGWLFEGANSLKGKS